MLPERWQIALLLAFAFAVRLAYWIDAGGLRYGGDTPRHLDMVGALMRGMAGRLPGDRRAGVAWTLALAVLVSPPVLNRLLAWITRRRKTPGGPPRLSWRDYRALVAWMVVFWLLSATTFTLYLLAFGLDLPDPAVVAGTFLVAWAIGFLTPIAPQGAGAFEVVFVALLAAPSAGALVVIVAGYRALVGLRDALAFAWGSWRGRADAVGAGVTAPGDDPARPAPR